MAALGTFHTHTFPPGDSELPHVLQPHIPLCNMTPPALWVIYHQLLYSTTSPTFTSRNQLMHGIRRCTLLEVFPTLTHIALPRRAHANTENDELFIGDVKAILLEPRIRMVIISIFPQTLVGADQDQAVNRDGGGSQDVKDSAIWLAAARTEKGGWTSVCSQWTLG
ncbi:hypothetical protein DFJ58DRAFT_727969 [Suillus subalutaceus]|uniref:uncharacterized protein n=1 Tax=Suillus subalutaceus TaxID=48586 RepID=UPI001B87E187|nr:uncharacterized protein DFJ58DRAFT_727969 [Suillus subalutaceus]KAG1854180.1 hypothetical protein DFJ58DRAFT_727969 [Suillus subalutaceus]